MPRNRPRRSEVWLVDLGLAAKVRPCLLLTGYPADDELALITIVCHTTSLRENEWEVAIPKGFLKKGAFHFQQIQSVPIPAFIRCLGTLDETEMKIVDSVLQRRLTMIGMA